MEYSIKNVLFQSGVERLMEFGPELLPEAMKAVYRFGKNRILKCTFIIMQYENDWDGLGLGLKVYD